MGFVVLLFVIISVFSGIFTFLAMQTAYNLPAFLNLPGAFAVGMSLLELSYWLSNLFGVFDPYAYLAPPSIPWYVWLAYLALGILWYVTIITIRHRWESRTKNQRNLEHWNPESKSGVDWLR